MAKVFLKSSVINVEFLCDRLVKLFGLLLIFILFTTSTQQALGQERQKKELQNYYEKNLSNLESIEGIWSVNDYYKAGFLEGSHDHVLYITKNDKDPESFDVYKLLDNGKFFQWRSYKKVAPNSYNINQLIDDVYKLAVVRKSTVEFVVNFPSTRHEKLVYSFKRIYPQPEDY